MGNKKHWTKYSVCVHVIDIGLWCETYLFVSDGVYDRINAAVEEDHDDGEVIETAGEVDVLVT